MRLRTPSTLLKPLSYSPQKELRGVRAVFPRPQCPQTTSTEPVPGLAWVLGCAGVVPFAVTAGTAVVGVWMGDPSLAATATTMQNQYGAAILSFLGAVQWGVAMNEGERQSLRKLHARLMWGATPCALATLSLWATSIPMISTVHAPIVCLATQASGFLLCLALDRTTRLLPGSSWYRRLRIPLTAGAVGSLLVTLMALTAQTRRSRV